MLGPAGVNSWLVVLLLLHSGVQIVQATTQCAKENDECCCNGKVSFGKTGQGWTAWRDLSGSIGCNGAAFGLDPAPNEEKTCLCNPVDTQCAREGDQETCCCHGKVRFGEGQRWTAWQDMSGSITCNRAAFGAESNDPAPGREKVCQCEAAGPSFTCDDGQQNGDESHVDCGGSCPGCADCGPPNRLHWVFANRIGPNQIYNGTCVVVCATGYRPGPPPAAVCQADGRWRYDGACSPADCGAPAKLNWVFDCTGPNQKLGGTCSPECAPGYLPLSPKPTAVCKEDGQWGFGGACDAVDCGAPARPHWSFAACVGGNRKCGGTCRPTCDVGYNWPPSHPSAVCSATGDWQYGGACNAADCGAPRAAGPSEHFNFMACDGPNQKYGGTCRPVCESGYTRSPSAPTATCQTDGQWAYGGQCLPVYCGPPTHAVVDWRGKCAGQPHGLQYYRDTCAARCPCEYIGLPTAECAGDGRWRYSGNCTPVVCQRCGAGDPGAIPGSCPDLWAPHQDGDSHVLESFAREYLGLTFEHAAAAQVGAVAVEAKSSSWRRWVQVWPPGGQAPPREADQYVLFWSGRHKVRFWALQSHGPPARVLSQVVLRQVTCRAPRRRHWKFAASKCGQWFPGGICAPECDYLYVGHPTAECRPGREWLFRGFCTLATCLNRVHDEAEETATDCGGECPVCPTVIDGRGDFDAALRSYGAVLPAHQRTAQWTATQA